MRYIQPHITGTFDAVSTIKGVKTPPNIETLVQPVVFSPVAAYPADE
jgi:hypothetical protein